MRKIILFLFKRTFCDNEFEYKASLDAVFGNRIPTIIKNCPSFSEKKLEEILMSHYLTIDGFLVLKYK